MDRAKKLIKNYKEFKEEFNNITGDLNFNDVALVMLFEIYRNNNNTMKVKFPIKKGKAALQRLKDRN